MGRIRIHVEYLATNSPLGAGGSSPDCLLRTRIPLRRRQHVSAESTLPALRRLRRIIHLLQLGRPVRNGVLCKSYPFPLSDKPSNHQLPIYFQAVRGATTFESGLMYLPSAVPFALAILAAGSITSFIGYYTPVMVAGSILMVIASGLFTTFSPTTPPTEWVSYQILYGIGVGLAFQQPYTAVQTVLPAKTVPTALVVLSFTQEIGGIVALSIAQNMFTNRLAANLVSEISGIHPKRVLRHGVLGIIKAVPESKVDVVKSAYNDAIVDVFYLAVALTGVTVLAALAIEWRSVKEEKGEGNDNGNVVQNSGEREKREQKMDETKPAERSSISQHS